MPDKASGMRPRAAKKQSTQFNGFNGDSMKKGFFLTAATLAMLAGIWPFLAELLAVLWAAILRPSRRKIFLSCSLCRQSLKAEAIT